MNIISSKHPIVHLIFQVIHRFFNSVDIGTSKKSIKLECHLSSDPILSLLYFLVCNNKIFISSNLSSINHNHNIFSISEPHIIKPRKKVSASVQFFPTIAVIIMIFTPAEKFRATLSSVQISIH